MLSNDAMAETFVTGMLVGAAMKADGGNGGDGSLQPTEDGATELYVAIEAAHLRATQLWFCQTVAHGVSVDWGDGSAPETTDGTGAVCVEHEYAATGEYIIRLLPADGCTMILGKGTSSTVTIFGESTNNVGVYGAILRKIVIGGKATTVGMKAFSRLPTLDEVYISDGVETLKRESFYSCPALRRVRLPDTLKSIGENNTFASCTALRDINLQSVTSVGASSFSACNALGRVTFESLTRLVNAAFSSCRGLQRVDLPEGISNIDSNVFQYCEILGEIHIKATTPPKLTQVLTMANSSYIIYIPKGAYEAYAKANYWSNMVDHIVEE